MYHKRSAFLYRRDTYVLHTLLWLFCWPFLGDMADELLPFLEPVPVEGDSEARIKGDTFRFKMAINKIVNEMAGAGQKEKQKERADMTALMEEMLEERRNALEDYEKQREKQAKQAKKQAKQAAAEGALQPVAAGASTSVAVAAPPAANDKAEPWNVLQRRL